LNRGRRAQPGTALGSGPTPSTASTTCGNAGVANAVRAQLASDQNSAEGSTGPRKLRCRHATPGPFRLSRTGTARHRNSEPPYVPRMRRRGYRADRCHALSGRLRQCRLS
jgi:hypothetical protein